MSDLFWLTDEQMERLRPFFPKSHGKPRVDDRRVLSGIIFVNRNGGLATVLCRLTERFKLTSGEARNHGSDAHRRIPP